MQLNTNNKILSNYFNIFIYLYENHNYKNDCKLNFICKINEGNIVYVRIEIKGNISKIYNRNVYSYERVITLVLIGINIWFEWDFI